MSKKFKEEMSSSGDESSGSATPPVPKKKNPTTQSTKSANEVAKKTPARRKKEESSSASSSGDEDEPPPPPPPKKVLPSTKTSNAKVNNKLEVKKPSSKDRKRKPTESDDEEEEDDDNDNQAPSTSNKKVKLSSPIKQEQQKVVKTNNKKNGKIEEADAEMDRTERAGSNNSIINVQTNVLPKEIYNFCKFLLELEEQNTVHFAGKKAATKFQTFLQNVTLDESIDLPTMQSSFNNILRWASNPHEMSMTNALKLVMDYVQTESILSKYPGYPKMGNSSWILFLKKFGRTGFNAGPKLREQFKNKSDKSVVEAEKEFEKIQLANIDQYSEFLTRYQDQLFQSQKDLLQKKINRMKREKGLAVVPRRAPVKKERREQKPPTAFELFKRTLEKKYAHLPEVEKEAKIMKKFRKMSDSERRIYEGIANSF